MWNFRLGLTFTGAGMEYWGAIMRLRGHRHASERAQRSWADHYKSTAARLRMLAEAEHEENLRDRLLEQASEYDRMAASLPQ